MIVDESFSTRDAGEAEKLIARVYSRGQLRESKKPFLFQQHVVGDERANLARFQISSHAEVNVDFDNVLGIGHRHGGRYRATSNGDHVNPEAPFLLRPGEAQSWSDELDLLMVNLDLAALGAHAGAESGSARVRFRFEDVGPLSSAHALRWQYAADYALGVLNDPELLRNDLMRQAAIDTLFATALVCFPISVISNLPIGDRVLPGTVRRAVQYIEDNAGEPISVADIAQASRLSIRALQAAFRRTLDMTPAGYLRTVRLSAARQDLLVSDPEKVTVAQIAHRWGFRNLGRFAGDYRREHGEYPRQTLQR